MRIGSTLLYLDGICYQSYNWQLLRPLGKIQNAIAHLDRFEVDEISIIRPIRKNEIKSVYLNDLKSLSELKTSTPISFGGGIRELEDLKHLQQLPFERFIFNSALFYPNNDLLHEALNLFGKQAILGLIPFQFNPSVTIYNSKRERFESVDKLNLEYLKLCDEIILHDTMVEGSNKGFNLNILEVFHDVSNKLILSGGVGSMINEIQSILPPIKSIQIENKVLHSEDSIRTKFRIHGV